MDQAFQYGCLSKQGLLYVRFYGLVCFLVLISFYSIAIFYLLNMSLCLGSVLLVWLLIKIALGSKQWLNKIGSYYGYCGLWYIGDISQYGQVRYDGFLKDWNMDCDGEMSVFCGILIYLSDRSRWQQWYRGVVTQRWRIVVLSINGIQARRRGFMPVFAIKVISVQWWFRQSRLFIWANWVSSFDWVFLVVRLNIDHTFTGIFFIKSQLGGEDLVITLSNWIKWSLCIWCFGKGFVSPNFYILCTLRILCNVINICGDGVFAFLRENLFGVWVFLVWGLWEPNVKTGFSLVFGSRAHKLLLAHVLFMINMEIITGSMVWLLQMKYIWIGESGYHHTHSFGSPEQINIFFK